MKQKVHGLFTFLSITIIIFLVAACNLPITTQPTSDSTGVLQTMVALSLTQTAIAAPPQQPGSEAATEIPTPMTPPDNTAMPIVHTIMPREMQAIESTIDDVAFNSDLFGTGLYERPYTEINMVYHGDVDLQKVTLSTDSTFFYFDLTLKDINPDTRVLGANYGAELDTDQDGRGDFLVWVYQPPTTANWDINGVAVFADLNNDVGSTRPLASDAPIKGDGYETELWPGKPMTDADGAWARLNPNNPLSVQIAVKRSLVSNPASFLWSAWADDQIKAPYLFDYNDAISLTEAGSPYKNSSDYPLKKLALVDNTCRQAWNFKPAGKEPGYCTPAVQPTNTFAPGKPTNTFIPGKPTNTVALSTPSFTPTLKVITKTPKPTFTPTTACTDVQIGAQVTDGSTWDPVWASGVTLCLSGDCQHPDSSGYVIWYRPAGGYTIEASSSYGITPASASVKLGCGQKSLTQFVIGPG
ncbi:MAG: hypothetical protein VB013_05225 [Anaerolineaceae bacterium]|nr:hypothetical protein [Anaerolineaceae bacterium]